MISEATRFRLEENAVAILLSFSGAMFGIGLLMQHGARAFSRVYGGTR